MGSVALFRLAWHSLKRHGSMVEEFASFLIDTVQLCDMKPFDTYIASIWLYRTEAHYLASQEK